MRNAIEDPPEAKPVYFIVGCPRSGSYLLSSILNASGRIAIPTETHFAPLFLPYLWMAGDLRNLKARRRVLKAIFMFLRIWLVRAEEERDYAAVTRHSLLAVEPESDRIIDSVRNYAGIVSGLFMAYARQHGALDAGDKSAFFDHMPLDKIDTAMGGRARFIHVVRDGRDVCVSWCRIKVGPRTMKEAAISWSAHIEGKQSWGRKNPDRYLEVRYEDLLTYPKKTLLEICAFVNLKYTDSLLDFHKTQYANDIAKGSSHAQLNKPLNSENQGKWKNALSNSEIYEFESIAGGALKSAGYIPLNEKNVSNWPQTRMKNKTTIRHLRLKLKNLLPFFAIIASWLKFRLDRLCNSRIWLRTENWLLLKTSFGRTKCSG